jgi:hypothetical protein
MFQEFARSIMPINAEVIVVTTALLVLIFDFFLTKDSKQYLGWFSLFGIIFAAIATYKLMGATVHSSEERSCSTPFRRSSVRFLHRLRAGSLYPSTT